MGKSEPDNRMRDQELVLRYFSFQELKLSSYSTPLKVWLNRMAQNARSYEEDKIENLKNKWNNMISVAIIVFDHKECFRRERGGLINKALFDLLSSTFSEISEECALNNKSDIRGSYYSLLKNEEFDDLISRAVDHKSRTLRRFELWEQKFSWLSA